MKCKINKCVNKIEIIHLSHASKFASERAVNIKVERSIMWNLQQQINNKPC